MATSVIQTLRSNLRTQLVARANLASVQVTRYTASAEDADWDEGISLGQATADQDWLDVGGGREEVINLDFHIWVRKYGDGDTVAAAAETRALALLAEIESQLRTDITVNGAVLRAEVASYSIDVTAGDQQRIATLTGVIRTLTEI